MGFLAYGAGIAENAGAATASTQPTTITASASANAKGAYTQLTAATSRAANWVAVTCARGNAVAGFLVDIAVGAGGSEQVIIPNLAYACRSTNGAGQVTGTHLFRVHIPAGSRIAARCQCSASGSKTMNVQVALLPGSAIDDHPAGFVDAYGQSTATSYPTSVDPGGVAHTKGSWVQLTAATSRPTRWLSLNFGSVGNSFASLSYGWLTDIGVGGAGSEQVILTNIFTWAGNFTECPAPMGFCFPVDLPAGVRLAARCQCDQTTATERILGVSLHGGF